MEQQLSVLAVMIITGSLLGAWLDVCRAARGQLERRHPLNYVLDVLLLVGSVLILAAGLVLGNWGEIRFYLLLGLAGGVWLYLVLASPLILPLWRRIFRLWRQVFAALISSLKRFKAFMARLTPPPRPK